MGSIATQPLPEEKSLVQEDGAEDSNTGKPTDDDKDPLEGREDLQRALYKLYIQSCAENRFARVIEVLDVQQGHLYWRGLQNAWRSERDECWNLPNAQHGLSGMPADADEMPRFDFVTNIYQAFGLSLIAAISQAPPRTRWFPDDAEEPEDLEFAEKMSKLSRIIERWNPVQIQMQDEVYHLWTGGVVGGQTRYIADGEKYGFESVEDYKTEEQEAPDEVRCAKCGWSATASPETLTGACPKCGAPLTEDNVAPGQTASVPVSAGEERMPKGRQVVSIAGALNLKRMPMSAREQADLHCLAYEEEIHYAKLRAAHPGKADKIKPGAQIGDDNGFERNARLAVMEGTNLAQQTGEAQSVMTTYARVWFRPTAFYSEAIKKEQRDELLKIFPRGCRVNFAGEVYCESEGQSMDDCWRIEFAFPGDGQHRPALGTSLLSVQDRLNTWSNIEAESYEYGVPITILPADLFDDEAEGEQRAEPGANLYYAPGKLGAGEDIKAKVMQFRNDQPSASMVQATEKLMGPVAQFLTGAFPALFGGGQAGGAAGDTASGYAMQRDQALGRCGISYVRLKHFHADLETLSCKDFCAHATGRVAMSVLGPSGDFESEAVDVTALEGDARAYPEGDENYPVLWSQQRAVFMQIMDSAQGPALMSEPDNAELGTKLIGIPGLVLPGADARRHAMRMIGMLTETGEGGQGEPGMPSVEGETETPQANVAALIDPVVDGPIAAAMTETASRWLISEAGWKCRKENPQGWQNVRAWMAEVKKLVPPPPPQEKPLSKTLTMALDKMPPEAMAQVLAKEYGVDLSPEDFIVGAVMDKLKKTPKPSLASPGQAPSGANPVAGA